MEDSLTLPPISGKDIFPILRHKMSKKIAQLTKVIYHLNIKNEDREFEIDDIRACHSREIQDILADASNKIKLLQDSLTSRHEMDQSAKLSAILGKHEREKKEAEKNFEMYKTCAEQRNYQLGIKYREKIEGIVKEVEKERTMFVTKMDQLIECASASKKELISSASFHADEIVRLKQQHSRNILTVQEGEKEVYAKLLADQVVVNEKKKAQLEIIHQSLLNECKEELHNAQRNYSEVIAEKDAKIFSLKQISTNNLHIAKENYLKSIDINTSEISCRYESEILLLKKKFDADIALREAEISTFRQQTSANSLKHSEEIEEHRLQLMNFKAEINQLNLERFAQVSEFQEIKANLQKEIDLKHKLFCDLEKAGKTHDSHVRHMENELLILDSTLSSKMGEIQALQNQFSQQRIDFSVKEETYKKELEILKRESCIFAATHEKEKEKLNLCLQEALESKRRESIEHQNQILKLLSELQSVQINSSNQLSELQSKHSLDLLNMKNTLQQKIVNAEETIKKKDSSYNDVLEQEQTKYKLAVEKLQKKYALQVEDLQLQLVRNSSSASREIAHLEEKISNLEEKSNKEIVMLQDIIGISKKEIEALRYTIEIIRKSEEKCVAENKYLKNEICMLETKIEVCQKKHEQEIATMKTDADEKISEVENRILEKYEKENVKADQRYVQQINKNYEQLKSIHSAEIADLELKLKCNANALNLALDEIETLKNSAENGNSALKEEHHSQIQGLSEVWNNRLSDAQEKYAKSEIELSERFQKIIDELDISLKTTIENQKIELYQMKIDFRRTEESSIEKALSAANIRHEYDLNSLRTKLIAERNDIIQKIEEKIKINESENAKNMEIAQNQIIQLQTKLSHNHSIMRKLEEDFVRDAEIAERKIEAAVLQGKNNLFQLDEKNREILEQIKSEHEQKISNCMKNEEKLRGAIVTLEERFDERPSRTEDIQKISKLESDLKIQNEIIHKCTAEISGLKLELGNREDMYNKKFNVNPVVGVMQVVKTKQEGLDSSGRKSLINAKTIRSRSSSLQSNTNSQTDLKNSGRAPVHRSSSFARTDSANTINQYNS